MKRQAEMRRENIFSRKLNFEPKLFPHVSPVELTFAKHKPEKIEY
jgi:hypothetical protein